jgi:single-strand DNA-binding protein
MNRVELTGNLVANPELRYTTTGKPVLASAIGHTESWQKDGTWHSRTSFMDFELWGDAAERAVKQLKKGSKVLIEGKLVQDSWVQDGQKRYKLKISARSVKLIAHAKPKADETSANITG